MDISKDWNKLLLLLAALLTLFLAQSYIRQSFAYVTKFEVQTVTPSDELPPVEKAAVVTSRNLVEKKLLWISKEIAPEGGETTRPIPLFKSITIVEIQGKLVDMSDPKAEKIRPPASNRWLLDNELDFLSSNVLEQDPDNDGFKNLAEWNAKTLPRDPASHPPFADKLEFIARRQQNYILEFASKPDENRFQVTRWPSSKFKRGTFIMRKGETSPDKFFRIDDYKEKEATGRLGNKVDVSELLITHLPDGRSVKLVRRVKTTIPTFFGQFKLLLDQEGDDFYVKKGDSFRLPLDPETEYKLIDIDAEKAVISFEPEPGKEVTIEIKLKK